MVAHPPPPGKKGGPPADHGRVKAAGEGQGRWRARM